MFVVFGTGGSNLGARALINISIKKSKNILFFDNIDPLFFQNQIVDLDINTTGFLVISKSGTTPENGPSDVAGGTRHLGRTDPGRVN